MKYVYTGPTFRFVNEYIALLPERQKQKPKTRDRYGSGTLHPRQFLGGSHFHLQRRQRSLRQKVQLFVVNSVR